MVVEGKSGSGVVKSVLSADTIVLRGKPVSGPPPEKLFSLSNITAPRLNLKEPEKEEPFAFAAREFVRKLLVGSTVTFTTEYTTATNGRDFGSVTLSKSFQGETDLTTILVKEGWAKVKQDMKREPSEDQLKLLEFQQNAQDKLLGLWSKESGTREIGINFVPEKLLSTFKGKPLPGILEQCRDASTFKVCLKTPEHQFYYLTLQLSGLKSPILRKGVPNMEDLVEPYAEEGRFFVESRLLQRDVSIVLEGLPSSNSSSPIFIGTVQFPLGNISEALLAEGFAKVNDWTLGLVTDGYEKYRLAEKKAKDKSLRLWKDYVTPKASSITELNFTAVVTKIVGPDLLLLEDVKTKEERKIQLSSIRGPKRQKNEAGLEIGYFLEAVEFLRSRLIGNTVQVSIDYVKPADGEYESRTCATVMNGSQNVAEALVSRGLAQVIRHKRDDDNRSQKYDSLLIAEDRAQTAKKGLWSEKELPTQRVSDASESIAKAKQFLPFFQKAGDLNGIVEYASSGSRFRVWIPSQSCRITLVLAGVRVPRAGSGAQSKSEPYGPEALNFVNRYVLQRDVSVKIESLDKTGGFIGSLFLKNPLTNIVLLLLEQGLAYVHGSSSLQNTFQTQMLEAEKNAKMSEKGIWKDFKPLADDEEPEELGSVQSLKVVDERSAMVSEIARDGKIYIQILGEEAQKLEKMMQLFGSVYKSSTEPAAGKVGEYVAAQFTLDNQWYRAQILSNSSSMKGHVEVLYIDYGNSEVIPLSRVRALKSQFSIQSLSPQAVECKLAYIRIPSQEDESYDDFLKELKSLTEGKVLKAKLLTSNRKSTSAVLYCNDKSINQELVRLGLAFIDKTIERQHELAHQANLKSGQILQMKKDEVAELLEAQSLAKRDHLNLWRYGDFREDDEL